MHWTLVALFITLFAVYLDADPLTRGSLFYYFLPLYAAELQIILVFMFLLPGLCDPEAFPNKKPLFLMVTYYIAQFQFFVMVNSNEDYLTEVDSFIMFFPLMFALGIHFCTMISLELFDNINELIIVGGTFINFIMLGSFLNKPGYRKQDYMACFIISMCIWIFAYSMILYNQIKAKQQNSNLTSNYDNSFSSS